MRIVSWNIEGRLSRFAEEGKRGSPEHIVSEIERLDSDIVFLAEAFDGERPIEAPIEERLKHLGYHAMIKTAYAETREKEYDVNLDPYAVFLSRLDVQSFDILRPAGIRSLPAITVIDPKSGGPIRYLGIHLDNRKEENRVSQVEEIISYIGNSSIPTVAMGDYNAMHSSSMQSKILRLPGVSRLIDFVPLEAPRYKLQCLAGMASGTALSRLETGTNLKDIDSRKQSTETAKTRDQQWLPNVPLVQIDHVYIPPEIVASGFSVSRDGGSDHRALSVELTVRLDKIS